MSPRPRRRVLAALGLVAAALAAIWGAGAVVLLREHDARQEALLEHAAERVEAELRAAAAALKGEAMLLAQEPGAIDPARIAPRLRTVMSEAAVDRAAVVDARGTIAVQVPSLPPGAWPPLSRVAAPAVALATLDGEPFLLAVAPVIGSPGGGMVALARRVVHGETPAPAVALVAVAGDRTRHSTLPGAPADGWAAAGAGGTRVINSVAWRLRPAGLFGGEALWTAVAESEAQASRQRLVLALTASFAVALAMAGGVTWLILGSRGPRPSAVDARDRDLQLLHAAAVAVGSTDDAGRTWDEALEILARVVRAEAGLVYRIGRARDEARLVGSRGLDGEALAALRVRSLSGTRLGEVARAGQPVVMDTTAAAGTDPPLAAAASAGAFATVVLVPIPALGTAWGVAALLSRSRRPIRAHQLTVLRTVAHQIGGAVARLGAVHEARTGRRRLQALARLSDSLASTLDHGEPCVRLVETTRQLFETAAVQLWLLADDGSTLELRASAEEPAGAPAVTRIRVGEGLVGRVARARAPITDGATGPDAGTAVPVIAGDRLIGVLALSDGPSHEFQAADLELLQSVGSQAALALDNARLFTKEHTRREQMATLVDFEREAAAVLDTDRLLDLIVGRASTLFRSRGVIYLVQDEQQLVPRAWAPASDPRPDPPLAFGDGVAGTAARERQGLLVNDYPASPYALPAFVAAGVRVAMGQPLLSRERLVGVIVMNRTGEEAPPFTGDDLTLLESFASQASTAITNAWLYEEARTYAERLAALDEVNRLVSSSLNADEVLGNLARAAAQFFDAPFVSVWQYDATSGRLHRALAHGEAGLAQDTHRELRAGEGAVGWVVQHREPIFSIDVRRDTRCIDAPRLARHGLVWLTAYPISIDDRVLGAFAVHRPAPLATSPESASLMGSLAAHAAAALENARLYAETHRRLAETRALLEVAEILNDTVEPRRRLERVAMKVAQVCGVERCSIELWDGDRSTPLTSQFADGRRVPALWAAFQRTRGRTVSEVPVNERVLATRRPVVVDDAAGDALTPREWVDEFGVKAYMLVPILRQDRIVGVVTLDRAEVGSRVPSWPVDLATAVVGQIALSLDNSRLFAEAQERLHETTTLLAVGQVLSAPDAGNDLMRRVAAEVGRAFGADTVGAYLLDDRKERLHPVGGYHVPPDLVSFFREQPIVLSRVPWLLAGWSGGRAVWSSDPHRSPGFDPDWLAALPPYSTIFAPTVAHGEPVGGLFLVWWQPGRTFEPGEVHLLEGVARQVGLAMENSELTRQTQRKLAETETLLSVSRVLSSTLEVDALLQHFLHTVTTILDADCVAYWVVSDDGEWLEPLAGSLVPAERLAAFRHLRLSLLKHPLYAEAARSRQPVFSTDAAGDERLSDLVREIGPHRSHLFLPLVAKDRVIAGLTAVWWQRARDFPESDLALLEAIGSQAAVALDHARLFQQHQRSVDELSVLHDLSRAVTGELDRAALIEAIREHVARVLDARNMVVILRDDDRERLEVALRVRHGVVDHQPPLEYTPGTVGLMSVVLTTARPLRSEDYAAECVRLGLEPVAGSAELRYWLGVPMISRDRVLGVIALRGGARPFTEAEERLMTNIAHLAALALRSARLYEERSRAFSELAAAHDQLVRTEKLRALGEMASGVAHDFNNLLAAILGRAQLLLRRVNDPKLRQWLQVIERSALDGAQTVRRLQEFTRIRRDRPLRAVDLNDVLRGALEITESRWHAEPMSRGVGLEVRTRLTPVPPIQGDAAELREAFTNLILNALDAMPDGGTLTVATREVGEQVEAIVTDTGGGMTPEVRGKIFDPFFTTKGPQGTGLGLSMTYGIVSRHGGSIEVESEPGRGSTFRVAFRAGGAMPWTEAASPAAAAPAATAGPGTLHVLIVDDEPAVRTVLADVVESAGHTTVVVDDGASAIARARAERFDLVLTDLAMPGVSGWRVARAVKQMTPQVPVHLVTGFGVELSVEERRQHGVDGVLAKPLEIQDILDLLAEVARNRPPGPPEDR